MQLFAPCDGFRAHSQTVAVHGYQAQGILFHFKQGPCMDGLAVVVRDGKQRLADHAF